MERLAGIFMKRLTVPFYAQNDNDAWIDGASGYVQCNITSHAMLLSYLKPEVVDWSKKNGYRELESYMANKFYKYSTNRGDHGAMTSMLSQDFKVKSEWRYDGKFSDIRAQIDRNKPVVIGVDYKVSGHILIVTGYDKDGFYTNDPFGSRNGTSNNYHVNPGNSNLGKDEYYSTGTLDAIWHSGEGWYRHIS